MRISDWSSDVCSSDLSSSSPRKRTLRQSSVRDFLSLARGFAAISSQSTARLNTALIDAMSRLIVSRLRPRAISPARQRSTRSEEHTSELQSLMRISYAVFCLKKKKHRTHHQHNHNKEYQH